MKLKFGRGDYRLYDVSRETDYFLDNGAVIQLVSKAPWKKQFVDWAWVNSWIFSKVRFQKLLKLGYIKILVKRESLIYYNFTEKVNEFPGEFR